MEYLKRHKEALNSTSGGCGGEDRALHEVRAEVGLRARPGDAGHAVRPSGLRWLRVHPPVELRLAGRVEASRVGGKQRVQTPLGLGERRQHVQGNMLSAHRSCDSTLSEVLGMAGRGYLEA